MPLSTHRFRGGPIEKKRGFSLLRIGILIAMVLPLAAGFGAAAKEVNKEEKK